MSCTCARMSITSMHLSRHKLTNGPCRRTPYMFNVDCYELIGVLVRTEHHKGANMFTFKSMVLITILLSLHASNYQEETRYSQARKLEIEKWKITRKLSNG